MQQVRPMPINPGGVVDPADLVGRDVELSRLMRAVESGGAKVLGERRIGKTSLLRALEDELTGCGDIVIRVSAETEDPAVFGQHLLDALHRLHPLRAATKRWAKHLDGEVNVNVGVIGIRLAAKGADGPGLDLFEACAEVAREVGRRRLVFILDEVTTLARALDHREPGAAEAFFHMLRKPRQEIDAVSVVVAGSIGLHHVLRDMSTVNDIDAVHVGPLHRDDAIYLARCLFAGAGRPDDLETATLVADHAACVPFYLHKLTQDIVERGAGLPTPAELDALVDDALRSDRWEVRHDLTRLTENFGTAAPAVRAILDRVAVSGAPLSIDAIRAHLDSADLDHRPDRDEVLSLVDRLEADHYLAAVGSRVEFATALGRRSWRIMRRLDD